MDLGDREIAHGATYVALSRVQEIQRLWIVGQPSTSRLTTPHADVKPRKSGQRRLSRLANKYQEDVPTIIQEI